jgi:hypothetical protein
MTIVQSYEKFSHSITWVLGALDLFAAARLTKKAVPPVLGDVNFLLTKRLTAPLTIYEPPLELISWTNASGYFLFSGEVRKPDRAGGLMLGPGKYQLRVESDCYQTIENQLVWPPPELEDQTVYDQARDLQLFPGPAYPFPEFLATKGALAVTLVRGSLFGAGGAPVKDVNVELTAPSLSNADFQAFRSCPTNAQGEWVISFIEKKRLADQANPPNFNNAKIKVNLPAGADYSFPLIIKPGEVNVVRQTALRGRVVKPGGIGLPGVKITTSVESGEALTRADGQWFFYYKLRQPQQNDPLINVTVTATAPGGNTKNVNTTIKPGATSVVPVIELS